jgi:hypothetical protein
MYCITEQQITFILNDIKEKGVEMEDLQLNLLDHVCCIIENELEANGDFEQFYFATIKTFYKKSLGEIEVETISLVNNKNYYVMKKVMMMSGIISAALFSLGIAFKFLHWPGASVCIVLGVGILSLVFLPLVLTLKVKEKQSTRDKFLLSMGMLSAVCMILSILFRSMHWPGSLYLGYLTIILLILVYLPVHLTFGIKNPDTKVNTVVTSVLLVIGCCLWLTLVVSPKGLQMQGVRNTQSIIRNNELLQQEQHQISELIKSHKSTSPLLEQGEKINALCNDIVESLAQHNTGLKTYNLVLEQKDVSINDTYFNDFLNEIPEAENKLNALRKLSIQYNTEQLKYGEKLSPIPLTQNILESSNGRHSVKVMQAFTDLFQIQMFILQNERRLLSAKPITALLQ